MDGKALYTPHHQHTCLFTKEELPVLEYGLMDSPCAVDYRTRDGTRDRTRDRMRDRPENK